MQKSEAAKIGSLLATLVLVACALTVTGFAIADRFSGGESGAASRKVFSRQADWKSFARGGHVFGDSAAPLSIVLFSDFQCPYCKLMFERLEQSQQRFKGLVSIRHRHWPLTAVHPRAYAAAIAAECASSEGRFDAMSRLLFQRQDSIVSVDFARLAQEAGVRSLQAFRSCLVDTIASNAVDRDIADALRLAAGGTPVTLFGIRRVDGAIAPSVIDSLIRLSVSAR